MSISRALLEATPPIQYEEPDATLRSLIKSKFPLLNSFLRGEPEDLLTQGLCTGLAEIFSAYIILEGDDGDADAFEDYERWNLAVIDADKELENGADEILPELLPLYPQLTSFVENPDISDTFRAGVVMAWLACHNESAPDNIEADAGLTDTVMSAFGFGAEPSANPTMAEQIEDDMRTAADEMFIDAVTKARQDQPAVPSLTGTVLRKEAMVEYILMYPMPVGLGTLDELYNYPGLEDLTILDVVDGQMVIELRVKQSSE